MVRSLFKSLREAPIPKRNLLLHRALIHYLSSMMANSSAGFSFRRGGGSGHGIGQKVVERNFHFGSCRWRCGGPQSSDSCSSGGDVYFHCRGRGWHVFILIGCSSWRMVGR